jgi:predicted permease
VILLLHLAARCLPRAFRDAFADEVVAQAERDIAVAHTRGRRSALRLWIRSLLNILWTSVIERLRPTWNAPPSRRGPTMRHQIDQWRLDLLHAMRGLRRSPGFFVVSVGTLALALGVTAGIFSVVNTVLIKPLPYGNADRLVFITGTAPGSDLPEEINASNEFYVHFKERARVLEDVALVQSFTSTLRVNDRVERVRMSAVTPTLFDTFGVAPVLGTLPAADATDAAVISHTLWQTWFAGRNDVIGQRHFMGGSDRTITGVMGPDFRFPVEGTLLWMTYDVRPQDIALGRFGAAMVGRIAPGTTMDAVAQELTTLSKELPERFGGSARYAAFIQQYRAVVRPLAEQQLGPASRPLWVLLAAGLVVLLIACANVANLFMVRAEGRHREMAVRQAIGAQRGQLLRVQMAEVLLIAVATGAAATLFTAVTLPAFVSAAPPGVPRLADASLDAATLVFTGVFALLAAMACGLLPAIRLTRPAMARLREGSRGSTGGRTLARNALVVAQTALALMLLIASGLLMRSHARLSAVDPGYDTTNIYSFQIAPEQPSLTDGPSYARFIMDFSDRLRALPGVERVGVIENMPLDEGVGQARFRPGGAAPDVRPLLNVTFAGEDYFETMGINVAEGRGFTRADATSSLGNVVLSRTAARMLWPEGGAVGRQLQREGLDTWETVVGVVDDVIQEDFRAAPVPLVYMPLTGQLPTQWRLSSPAYVIKSSRADSIGADVRRIVREIAPEAPMYRAFTIEELVQRELLGLSFTMLALSVVSILALVLGAVGLYGVLSYVVAERTREIGVRMALGAQVSVVRRMVVAQGAKVVGVGIAIGVLGAALSMGALRSLLFEVETMDPMTFAGTVGFMVLVGLAASYLPARRASNVDPIQSLRGE